MTISYHDFQNRLRSTAGDGVLLESDQVMVGLENPPQAGDNVKEWLRARVAKEDALDLIITASLSLYLWRGVWDATANYGLNTEVKRDGSYYSSATNVNVGNDPLLDDGTNWTGPLTGKALLYAQLHEVASRAPRNDGEKDEIWSATGPDLPGAWKHDQGASALALAERMQKIVDALTTYSHTYGPWADGEEEDEIAGWGIAFGEGTDIPDGRNFNRLAIQGTNTLGRIYLATPTGDFADQLRMRVHRAGANSYRPINNEQWIKVSNVPNGRASREYYVLSNAQGNPLDLQPDGQTTYTVQIRPIVTTTAALDLAKLSQGTAAVGDVVVWRTETGWTPEAQFQANKDTLYEAVKEILVHGGSPGAVADDVAKEIDILTGQGGSSGSASPARVESIAIPPSVDAQGNRLTPIPEQGQGYDFPQVGAITVEHGAGDAEIISTTHTNYFTLAAGSYLLVLSGEWWPTGSTGGLTIFLQEVTRVDDDRSHDTFVNRDILAQITANQTSKWQHSETFGFHVAEGSVELRIHGYSIRRAFGWRNLKIQVVRWPAGAGAGADLKGITPAEANRGKMIRRRKIALPDGTEGWEFIDGLLVHANLPSILDDTYTEPETVVLADEEDLTINQYVSQGSLHVINPTDTNQQQLQQPYTIHRDRGLYHYDKFEHEHQAAYYGGRYYSNPLGDGDDYIMGDWHNPNELCLFVRLRRIGSGGKLEVALNSDILKTYKQQRDIGGTTYGALANSLTGDTQDARSHTLVMFGLHATARAHSEGYDSARVITSDRGIPRQQNSAAITLVPTTRTIMHDGREYTVFEVAAEHDSAFTQVPGLGFSSTTGFNDQKDFATGFTLRDIRSYCLGLTDAESGEVNFVRDNGGTPNTTGGCYLLFAYNIGSPLNTHVPRTEIYLRTEGDWVRSERVSRTQQLSRISEAKETLGSLVKPHDPTPHVPVLSNTQRTLIYIRDHDQNDLLSGLEFTNTNQLADLIRASDFNLRNNQDDNAKAFSKFECHIHWLNDVGVHYAITEIAGNLPGRSLFRAGGMAINYKSERWGAAVAGGQGKIELYDTTQARPSWAAADGDSRFILAVEPGSNPSRASVRIYGIR